MEWPKYENPARQRISLKHLNHFREDKEAHQAIGNVLLLIAIYVLGTQFAPLWVNFQKIHQVIAQSLVLTAIDEFLTGGALGNLGLFALGVVPLFFLRRALSPNEVVESQNQKRKTFLKLAFLSIAVVLAVFVTFWYITIGAVPGSILSFIIILTYLLIGLGLLLQVSNRLKEYGISSLIYLNALIIGVGYIQALILTHNILDLVIFCLVILFILSFVFLLTRNDKVSLINIRVKVRGGKEELEGELPIPAMNIRLQLSLLIFTFAFVISARTLVNFFFNPVLSPFGSLLLDSALLILLYLATVLLFANNELISNWFSNSFSQFNSPAIASRLKVDYWIIRRENGEEVNVGPSTAKELTKRSVKSSRFTYIFYLIWIIIFSAVELGSQVVYMPITSLPLGPLGFIIVLIVCLGIGYSAFEKARKYIQSASFEDFWVPKTTPPNFQPFTENFTPKEFAYAVVQSIMPVFHAIGLPEAKMKSIQEVIDQGMKISPDPKASKIVPDDRFNTMDDPSLQRRDESNPLTLKEVLLNFLTCTILSIFITCVFAAFIVIFIVIWQHFKGPLSSSDVLTIAIGVFSIFIGILASCFLAMNLHEDIKALVKQRKKRKKKN
jgi:hypothetical protein